MNFPDCFERVLKEQKLIRLHERLGIACSGGPDSTALFYLLSSLSEKWGLKIGLLHFNHGLRGEGSNRDERFVRRLAETFGVPFYAGRGNIEKLARREKISLEEAGRQARYRFFIETAKKYRVPQVALGHTRDDQAETVLMRVFQGTGLKGLCGIREEMKMQNVRFVRPLLDYSKEALERFLKERKIAYRRDSSNKSRRFLRNRIRLEMIPWLVRNVNPRTVEAIARIPTIVNEEVKVLEQLENEAWEKCFKSKRDRKVALDRKVFLKSPPTLQFRVLDRALKILDARSGLNFELWRNLRPSLKRTQHRCSLPRNIDFTLSPSKIFLRKRIFL